MISITNIYLEILFMEKFDKSLGWINEIDFWFVQ